MDNWIITIEGTGSHHNGKSYDADMIARDIVQKLRAEGQNVDRATFHASSRDVIVTQPK